VTCTLTRCLCCTALGNVDAIIMPCVCVVLHVAQALRDAGADQAAMYADMVASSPDHWTSKAPYVPVVCAYSRGFRTAAKLTFSDAGELRSILGVEL
jgi:hypothetical protein